MNRNWLPMRFCLLLVLLWSGSATAQEFDFHPPATVDEAGAAATVRDLAERILPVYQEPDRERYLQNVSALQLLAGDAAAALDSWQSLQARRTASPTTAESGTAYALYLRARAAQISQNKRFDRAYAQALRDLLTTLADREAFALITQLQTSPGIARAAAQRAFDQMRGRDTLKLSDAVDLLWAYLAMDAARQVAPLMTALAAEDARRRYLIDDAVLIKTHAGAQIHARVVRPKAAAKPLPGLLEYRIELSGDSAIESAAHGYVGVVAYTRGKMATVRERVIPFVHDGEDARAVIAWMLRQPWSDGRVAMRGEGYAGFAAWAAAKRAPAALKAIVTTAAMAPGIDFPMMGNIVHNAAYRWAEAHTNPLDAPLPSDDDARWAELDRTWFGSGRSYRALDLLAGHPNRAFRLWLNHPSYDRYWQKMIPFGTEFARLSVPVLNFGGGSQGALYYFSEQLRQRAAADHSLVIPAAVAAPPAVFRPGPVTAPSENTLLADRRSLTYAWLDAVLRGGPRPAVLKERVNVQVAGSADWVGAPTLEALSNTVLRFYLDTRKTRDVHRLGDQPAPRGSAVQQTVELRDRSDTSLPMLMLRGQQPSLRNAVVFVSDPLKQSVDVVGLLNAQLDVVSSQSDADLELALYEQTPTGRYRPLLKPYAFRASYAADRTQRQPLSPGQRQRLAVRVPQVLGQRVPAGSRIVLGLGVSFRPDRQINYGAGKDVNEESIADAHRPLKIRWLGSSYIELPVRR